MSRKWTILRLAKRASELPPVCCVHNSLPLSPAAPSPSGHSDLGSLAGAQSSKVHNVEDVEDQRRLLKQVSETQKP